MKRTGCQNVCTNYGFNIDKLLICLKIRLQTFFSKIIENQLYSLSPKKSFFYIFFYTYYIKMLTRCESMHLIFDNFDYTNMSINIFHIKKERKNYFDFFIYICIVYVFYFYFLPSISSSVVSFTIFLYLCLSVCLFSVFQSLFPYVCMSVYLSVCLFVCLSLAAG